MITARGGWAHRAYQDGREDGHDAGSGSGTIVQRRHRRKATGLGPGAAPSSPTPELPRLTSRPDLPRLISRPDQPQLISRSDQPRSFPRPSSPVAPRAKHSKRSSTASLAPSPDSSSTNADQDQQSVSSTTTAESRDFILPHPSSPFTPLRKSSAINLRRDFSTPETASPRLVRRDFSTSNASSPTLCLETAHGEGRKKPVRMRRDRQPSIDATASPSNAPKQHASRARSRGMTTAAPTLALDLDQFRSPSIPDLRKLAMAATYKPERGPSHGGPITPKRLIPPMPWADDDESRASFRSGVTTQSCATSAFFDASETERSSLATQSSSASIYSRERPASTESDDFDFDDFVSMYANGFTDDEPRSTPSNHERPRHAPSSAQTAISDGSELRTPAKKLHPRRSPDSSAKYDSKCEADMAYPSSPPMPPQTFGSPLMSHPINPVSPQSSIFSWKDGEGSGPVPLSPVPFDRSSPRETKSRSCEPDEPVSPTSPPAQPVQPPAPQAYIPADRTTFIPVPRDRYGFKTANQYISAQEYDAWDAGYSKYLERRRSKWNDLMSQWSLPTENPTRFPARSDKVKRYIRKGIPPEWRGACWFWYSGGHGKLAENPGLYAKLLGQAEKGHLNETDREIIERDLNRTFPDNITFKPDPEVDPAAPMGLDMPVDDAEPEIIQSLRRVLQAFAIHNPSIGYCQSLNFLAGMLLLFLKDEERTFHMLNIICNQHLPGIHGRVLESNVDVGVLMTCIRDAMPQVWAKIDDISDGRGSINTARLPTVSLATTPWFMSCFIGSLPTECVLRVWDVFFYEGSKTLFRIALTIFKAAESEIRTVRNENMEVFQIVQHAPRHFLDANLLMESCYKRRNGFGHLSQDVVDSRRRERRAALERDRSRKTGLLHLPDSQDPVRTQDRGRGRGRRGTISRALSRARSRKTSPAPEPPMPPTPSLTGVPPRL